MRKSLYVEPYEGTSPYIFISYAHTDKHLIQPVLARLEQEGYRFWYDRGIHGGEAWARVIANRIKECSALLLFVSPDSMASKNCSDELAYAQNNQKPIIMIMLEQDVQIPEEIDMQTSRYQRLFTNQLFDLDELLYEMGLIEALNPCHGVYEGKRTVCAPKYRPRKRKSSNIIFALIALLAVLVIVAVALVGGKLHNASDTEQPDTGTTTTTIQQETEKDEEKVADNTPVTASLNDLVSLQQHYEFVQFPKYDVFGTLHASYYEFGLDWVTNETETAWILNKEYKTFSCEITFLDDVATAENLSVSFYADDQLVHFEPDFSNQSRVRTISFDVSGAQKLTIKATYQGDGFSNPYCSFILVNDSLEN